MITWGSRAMSCGKALGDLPAVVEHDDAVADVHDQFHHVLDQHDRHPEFGVDAADAGHGGFDFAGVQPGRHLVEQQQLGVRADGRGHGHALLSRHRQLAHQLVPKLLQSHLVEDPVGLGLGARARAGVHEAAHQDVFPHREIAGGGVDLEGAGESSARHLVGRQAGDVLPVENDSARRGREHAGDAIEAAWSCRRRWGR